jgi:D-sedoheptulose 7-phosphate isomerase
MMEDANQIACLCVKSLKYKGTIFFIGNGGSAADAQHLAAELVGKLNYDRPPLAAISLTTDTSIITAIGNDYGFEYIFSRQIEAIGKAGDVLIAMSTSGNSANVLKAMDVARKSNMHVIGLTGGNTSGFDSRCDIIYNSPSTNTQEIQEDHIKLGHIFCGLIEAAMFPR